MNRITPWASSMLLHVLIIASILAVGNTLKQPVRINLCDFQIVPTAGPKPIETEEVRAPQKTPPKPVAKPRPQPVVQPQPQPRPVVQPQPIAEPQPLPEPISAIDPMPIHSEIVAEPQPVEQQPVATTTPEVRVASPESIIETQADQYFGANFSYIRDRVIASIRYPLMARRQGWSGQVKVEFTILTNGKIRDLKVINSSGHTLLDKQAMRAVQAAVPFPPPPVIATITLPINFELN